MTVHSSINPTHPTHMPHAVSTRHVRAADLPAIERLHEDVFGPGRFARSAYRVREGKGLFSRFCRLAECDGKVIAALRLTQILVGDTGQAALLGPIVVAQGHVNKGFGRRLIVESLEEMRQAGLELVVLVGDEPYYGRLGFKLVPGGQITFPGPVNPERILAYELEPGALARFKGRICAAPPQPQA